MRISSTIMIMWPLNYDVFVNTLIFGKTSTFHMLIDWGLSIELSSGFFYLFRKYQEITLAHVEYFSEITTNSKEDVSLSFLFPHFSLPSWKIITCRCIYAWNYNLLNRTCSFSVNMKRCALLVCRSSVSSLTIHMERMRYQQSITQTEIISSFQY